MSEQDITDGYQCPNVDCDNCQIYNEDELPTDKRCPECSTILVTFAYDVEEEEEEVNEEDYEDGDPEDKAWINDND